jgi:hypothetical protein
MAAPKPYQNSWGNAVPGTLHIQGAPRTLEQLFTLTANGWVQGCRVYNDVANTGLSGIAWLGFPILGHIFTSVAFDQDLRPIGGNTGWIHRYFSEPWYVTAGSNVYLFWWSRTGNIWYDPLALNGITIVSGDITVPADTGSNGQSYYDSSASLDPRTHSTGSRWGIDLIFLKKTT